MNFILTNYFVSKKDPQRNKHHLADKYDLVKGWVESLTSLNLNGVIFYDNLSMDFIKKVSSKNISFAQYTPRTSWSLNDERFLCFYEYLYYREDIENVFLTDLFDVSFNRNPFDLISDEYKVYVGVDGPKRNIRKANYVIRKMKIAYDGCIFHEDKVCLSAGVFGGKRINVLRLLKEMVVDFEKCNSDKNTNMGVLNKCIYDLFSSNMMAGKPVCSKFKGYEKSGNFAIRHK
jgi:hypothetical protein